MISPQIFTLEIFFYLQMMQGKTMTDVQSKMNNALEEVYLWTQNNKLLLNTNNTKVMVTESRQRIQMLNEDNLNVHIIRSTTIECVYPI